MRAVVDREGVVITNRRSKLTRAHPLLPAERGARRDFERIWTRMHNEFDPDIDGRLRRTVDEDPE
jgi:hypothetical protein